MIFKHFLHNGCAVTKNVAEYDVWWVYVPKKAITGGV